MNNIQEKVLTLILLIGATIGCSINVNAQSFTDKEYYKKSLWMTTRFYGAQRSGEGVNWLTAKHTVGSYKGTSYIKDADGEYGLTGGWFDCGDYVKFGQTEFYSCYMLLLGYSEFTKGYRDYYSADYHGYVNADDYTYESAKGEPDQIADVLNECKYATDYFMKAMCSQTKFYYQVGDGNADHSAWTTSVYKSAEATVSEGGESDGSRPVYSVSEGATSMVALCGASLAAMSRLYAAHNETYANQCLEKAKVAAAFIEKDVTANKLSNLGSANGSFYPVKGKYYPDMVIMYCELYRATLDNTYKTKAETYYNKMGTDAHGYSLCYNNTEDLAEYLMYKVCGNSEALTRLKAYATSYEGPNYMLNIKGDNRWGPLRYCAAQAFAHALYSSAAGITAMDQYTAATIDYILGYNSANYSFVVGVGSNYPKKPHYRNVYLNDDNNMSSCTMPVKYSQLGYMVGGSRDNPSSYSDDINNYYTAEGGIDYNAGLVGALGYMMSIIDPISDNYKGEDATSYTVEDNTVDGDISEGGTTDVNDGSWSSGSDIIPLSGTVTVNTNNDTYVEVTIKTGLPITSVTFGYSEKLNGTNPDFTSNDKYEVKSDGNGEYTFTFNVSASSSKLYLINYYCSCWTSGSEVTTDVKITKVSTYTPGKSNATSIDELSQTGNIVNVYPNPASDYITVNFGNKQYKAQIICSSGSVVKSVKVCGNTLIYISEIPSGMYIIKANGITYKFIKQ